MLKLKLILDDCLVVSVSLSHSCFNGRNKLADIVPTKLSLNAFWVSVIYGQLANIFPCKRKHSNEPILLPPMNSQRVHSLVLFIKSWKVLSGIKDIASPENWVIILYWFCYLTPRVFNSLEGDKNSRRGWNEKLLQINSETKLLMTISRLLCAALPAEIKINIISVYLINEMIFIRFEWN